jgi:hypothetical protein
MVPGNKKSLSSDLNWGFTVEKNISITAKFIFVEDDEDEGETPNRWL